MKSFLPIILIVLSFGLFYVYIGPKYASIKDLQTEQSQYKEVLQDTETMETLRDDLLAKYNAITPAQLTDLKRLLPSSIDTVRLTMDIDSIARQNGIVLNNIQVGGMDTNKKNQPQVPQGIVAPVTGLQYQTVSVSFSFATSYGGLITFLHALEGSLRILDVTSLSLQPAKGANAAGQYDVSLSLNTYWLPDTQTTQTQS